MKKSIGIILLLVVVAVGFGKDLLAEKTISRIDKPMITELSRDFEAKPLPANWKNPIHREPTDYMGPWITYTRWDSMYYYLTGLPTHYGMMYRTYDFGLTGAITFDSIEAYWASYGLYTDSMIKFQIYGADGTTLLWESPPIKVESTDFYLAYDVNPDTVLTPGDIFYVVINAASYAAGGPQIVTEAQPTSIAPRRRTCVSGIPGTWNVTAWSYCLSVKATSASAPTYDLNEGFDGATFPPTGWTTSIITGTIDWEKHTTGSYYRFINTYLNGDNTGITPTPAPGMAAYRSYYANAGDEAALISPAIATSTIDYERIMLRFYMFRDAQYSTSDDTLFIETSTDGGTIWTTKSFVTRYFATSGWYQQNIDCGIFAASSNVKIRFRAKGAFGNNIYIDHITSWREAVTANDVGILDITIPSYNPIWVGETRAISVTLKNYGALTQTSIPVTYDPGDGSTPVTETWTGSLPMGGTTTFVFADSWNCNTAGDLYSFKAYTGLVGDANAANDTSVFYVAVCPLAHIPPYVKDFNEPWGPYGDNPPFCGWTIIAGGDELTPTWNANDWMHYNGGAWIQYSPVEHQNDWLISPKFDCSTPGFYELGFYSNFTTYAAPDTGEVFYSTDDGLTWNLITGFYGDGATIGSVNEGVHTFDMTSAIAGEDNVKFAFNYRAYDSYYWLVDNFYLDYLPAQTLTIIATNGTVTKNPNQTTYAFGSSVELTAVPDSGYAFANWSGDLTGNTNPATIVMDGDKTVTANFIATGWNASVPMAPVKDGGALVSVTLPTDEGSALYAFRGWKTPDFYKFDGTTWSAMTAIPVGLKYKPGSPLDSTKVGKKGPGKGASFAWDGENTIYAIKGNGLWEFWAYDIPSNVWSAKAYFGGDKALKGGSCITYANGKVYALASAQKVVSFFWSYDVATDSWTALTAPTLGPNSKKWKDGTDLITFDEATLYAIKGGDKYNAFWKYEIATDVWTEVESIPLAYPTTMVEKPKKVKVADGGSLATDGEVIYAIKGGGKDDFWMYTPGTPGVWTGLTPVLQGDLGKKGLPKTGAGLAMMNGYVYLLKGNKTDELYFYIPGAEGDRVNANTIATVSGKTTEILNFSLNASTFGKTINYTIPAAGKVSLKLYNASGRLVETIHNGYANAGNYSANLSNISNGVYFLKYSDGTNSAEAKIIVQ